MENMAAHRPAKISWADRGEGAFERDRKLRRRDAPTLSRIKDLGDGRERA
jgi:hypothetical protein